MTDVHSGHTRFSTNAASAFATMTLGLNTQSVRVMRDGSSTVTAKAHNDWQANTIKAGTIHI